MPIALPQKEIASLHQNVFRYYEKFGRKLPWRDTTDPYYILVSECMLQQTQVERVIPFYERWLKRFSSVEMLYEASLREVLQQWQGLGYNRRGQNLHKTAGVIVEEFQGDVLSALPHYKKLPGVGEYTASAVQAFAANKDIAAVDTNIRRILIAHFHLDEKISKAELADIAYQCVPKGRSREWHNALMDYGANYMTAKRSGIASLGKQGQFEGSDRQVRSRILRFLLSHTEGVHKEKLFRELSDIDKKRTSEILKKMIQEKLIIWNNNHFDIHHQE